MDNNLRSALTATAHALSGGDFTSQAICEAFRGVVARAGRYDAQASPTQVISSPDESPVAGKSALPCMTPDCDKPRQWKGLCRSCYAQGLRLIDRDGVTWDELEALGMCDQEHKPFTALYLARKQQAAQA